VGETEVTARFVGSIDVKESLGALGELGFFAQGTDRNGSGVWRFMVESQDPTEACRLITTAVLQFSTIVVHDVRPGPYEEISDGDEAEEQRTIEFLERLDATCAAEAAGRITGLGENDLPRRQRVLVGSVTERVIGSHPVTSRPVEIRNGRFGPYLGDGQVSVSLLYGDDPAALTLGQAVERLARAKGRRVGRSVDSER
jgi:hypothetical protein